LRLREEINIILERHTGQPLEVIQRDTERDFYMNGDTAMKYGLIDHVLHPSDDKKNAEESS
jgi:ATP-dependent Clp protease protease subunit